MGTAPIFRGMLTLPAQKHIIAIMPRTSRVVAAGFPHHITQRGNYQQVVFEADEDHTRYLRWLRRYSQKYMVEIWAYCLMKNHVHFIAVPMRPDSLALTFNALHMRYAQYLNRKRGVTGHLWQGRFYSCILDERHVFAALRYVENNPVRAGIVQKSHEYKWSSARGHVLEQNDPVLSDCYLVQEIGDWSAYLQEQGSNMTAIDHIRQSTRTGHPCGDQLFIAGLEEMLDRCLQVRPKGRPPAAK